MKPVLRNGILAGAVAGVLSGAPSTAHALRTRTDPLEATLAAGSILLPRETRRARLLAAAVPVHAALSLGWGVVLAAVLPRTRTTAWGALAGLAIAAVDLGLAGRHLPRIRALPVVAQVADHLAFGAVAGAVLGTLRDREVQTTRAGDGLGVRPVHRTVVPRSGRLSESTTVNR